MSGRHKVTDEIRERAALHALGLLDQRQAGEFEDHLRAGCPVCEAELRSFRETAAALPQALPPSAPPPRLRAELLSRIAAAPPGPQVWKAWPGDASRDLHVVRAEGGSWQPTGVAGVSVKQLYVDPVQENVTMLVRMEPGAAYPSHRHGGAEQCLVLEGDLRVGDLVLHAGDYQCAATDTVHAVSSTERGCLLLIVSSQHDQLLA